VWKEEEEAPHRALLDLCLAVDPDQLRDPAFAPLIKAVKALVGSETAQKAEGEGVPRWPEMTEVASELASLPGPASLASLALQLLSAEKTKRPDLVTALAASGKLELEEVARRWAQEESALIPAWLAGLPSEKLEKVLENSAFSSRIPVFAALVRRAALSDKRVEHIVRCWMKNVPPGLQEAASAVMERRTESGGDFWNVTHADETLRWLARLSIGSLTLEIPIDVLAHTWLRQPAFWELLMSRPLEPRLLRRIIHLVPELRAVLGLCHDGEWEALLQSHKLVSSLDWRSGRTPF
jgi:hypothetical protein